MMATLQEQASHRNWFYTEARPRFVPPDPTTHSDEDTYGDCSKGTQYIAKWSGAPDPMGMGFGPYGNSQSIWAHLHHASSAADLKVGDCITFGIDGDQHATMVLEAGSDPLLWSFGHQGAPNTYRLSQDGRPAQFCMMPIAPYKPSPADKLRAETGYWAWVAWRLGEGDWKHYGKKNQFVRPNVPRWIPSNWWKRYAKFIKNRKKGNKSTTS